jgi:hypothetical protein
VQVEWLRRESGEKLVLRAEENEELKVYHDRNVHTLEA